MILLFKTIFGSNLYGTATETSDIDYKGVYAPAINDIILGKVKLFSSINISNKENQYIKSDSNVVESEYFTIQNFLKHIYEGQTIAIDMLYSSEKFWSEKPSEFWINNIAANREKFLSKNINSFVKYAVKQAAKYGIKGSRLNSVNKLLTLFKNTNENTHIVELVPILNDYLDEHTKLVLVPNDNNKSMLLICGKKFSLNTKIKYIISPLEKFIEEYGDRAKQAAFDKGVDKKAISHAFRAAYEVKELVETRNLVFPLKDRNFLRDVKYGKLSYKEVAPILEDLIDEVKYLVDNSDLPDTPQINMDELILNYYMSSVY